MRVGRNTAENMDVEESRNCIGGGEGGNVVTIRGGSLLNRGAGQVAGCGYYLRTNESF